MIPELTPMSDSFRVSDGWVLARLLPQWGPAKHRSDLGGAQLAGSCVAVGARVGRSAGSPHDSHTSRVMSGWPQVCRKMGGAPSGPARCLSPHCRSVTMTG